MLMNAIKLILLTISLIICLFSLSANDRVELNIQLPIFQLEDNVVKIEKTVTQTSRASLFRHSKQQARRFFSETIHELVVSYKEDEYFYSEPIHPNWFDTAASPTYRTSQWKKSIGPYRQLALIG